MTHCAVSQTDIEPRYPGPDSTRVVRFVLSSLVHKCHTCKLIAGLKEYSDPQQRRTQLITHLLSEK